MTSPPAGTFGHRDTIDDRWLPKKDISPVKVISPDPLVALHMTCRNSWLMELYSASHRPLIRRAFPLVRSYRRKSSTEELAEICNLPGVPFRSTSSMISPRQP